MKKITIILLFILGLAAAAYFLFFQKNGQTQGISLATGKAQYGYLAKTVTATGTVQPVDTVSVGAQVSGVVKNVYADINDIVKQGQLLATVDPSIIIAQTEQAKAALANTQSNLDYQQNNFDRQNHLYLLGAISKADYQLAQNQYLIAKAAVAGALAQLTLAEKNLSYTNIYSPINGVVLNRSVSQGQTIASSFNAPTLFVIARDLAKMQVRAAVDEADIGDVAGGERASFTVDAFPDETFEGSVLETWLHPSVSANVVTYTTLINVDNRSMKLKPGMTANINIYLQEDSNALVIPVKALSFRPDTTWKKYIIRSAERDLHKTDTVTNQKKRMGRDMTISAPAEKSAVRKSYVWTMHGDTLIEKRILTGLSDDSYVKVIKGLSAGEEVILSARKGSSESADNTQRSPFMPQMRRRSTTGGGRNQ